ncbi:Cobalt-zinc-cadmium resistance protein CzcC [Xylophilus ampelinus]|nr:TolC family protein [Variovorax sp.]VTY34709.1 Cobalt-zinc-cadmium resistance protein CzcC [Xylophilus ampelinus]
MLRIFAPVALAAMALASGSAAFAQMAAPTPPAPQGAVGANQSGTPLTLTAAIVQAQDANPLLAAARDEVSAAEGARIQAGALPNPTLDAQVEDTRRETRQTTITLAQPIELGGKRAARVEAADRAVDIAKTQLDARRIDVQAGVTAAFFAALVAQERVTLAQASLDLARRGTDAANKRVTAGKVSPVEETRAKVAEAGVRIELLQAQGELRTSFEQLRAAIGPGPAITALDGNALQTPPLPTATDVALRADVAPAVQEARLEVKRFGALADLERAKRIPDVTVTLGATRQTELARNQAVIGVSIPLPIFNTNRGAIVEAVRRQDKAEDLARATELRVRTDALAARQRYETSLAEVATLRQDVLPGAQSAFDAATKGFELGKFSYLEALDAQRTLLQSRAQYLRALADAHRSVTDVQRLLGPDSASAPPSSTSSQERP